MEESDLRGELAAMLYNMGFVCHHPVDNTPSWREKDPEKKKLIAAEEAKQRKVKNKREFGKMDLLVMNPVGPTIMIECKKIDMFDKPRAGHNGVLYFRDIRPYQRDNLDRWAYHMIAPGYLMVGTIETGTEKRRMWLIDWPDWVRAETTSWNESVGKFVGFPVHSSQGLGFDQLFDAHELIWKGNKIWEAPEWHSIRRMKRFPRPADEWAPISIRFSEMGASEIPVKEE